MTSPARQSTGIAKLDERLGGGLLSGTLTVIVGATGIGKTQLGLQFANAGIAEEQQRGIVLDMSARGDGQNHAQYARRMFDWHMAPAAASAAVSLDGFFAADRSHGDYLHVFQYSGRRVTRGDLDFDQWHEWQGEINARLRGTIGFLYGNFARGTRRMIIDGVEPADRPGESIQFNLFEYVYHQVVRKEPAWVARDLFREHYRANAATIAEYDYDSQALGCLLLCTSHESMLDDLIARGIDQGDVLSNANTLIYMGKTRDANRIGRGLYIAKHRGSACSDEIVTYSIDDGGICLDG